jgi:hypothetical protein
LSSVTEPEPFELSASSNNVTTRVWGGVVAAVAVGLSFVARHEPGVWRCADRETREHGA